MDPIDQKKLDLKLSPAQRDAHDLANSRGEAGYIDPISGLFSMTQKHLLKQGFCCGNGCRHCPYDWQAVSTGRLKILQKRIEKR